MMIRHNLYWFIDSQCLNPSKWAWRMSCYLLQQELWFELDFKTSLFLTTARVALHNHSTWREELCVRTPHLLVCVFVLSRLDRCNAVLTIVMISLTIVFFNARLETSRILVSDWLYRPKRWGLGWESVKWGLGEGGVNFSKFGLFISF